MKRLALALGLVLTAAVGGSADERFSAGLWGGYATFRLDQANGALKATAGFLERIGLEDPEVTEIGDGWCIGLDGGMRIARGLASPEDALDLVLRAGYCVPGAALIKWVGETTLSGYDVKVDMEMEATASAIPVLAGVRYVRNAGPVTLYGGFGAGVLFASMAVEHDQYVKNLTLDAVAADDHYKVPYAGTGLVEELSAGAAYRLWRGLSVGIEAGYRFASPVTVKATKDVDYNDDGDLDDGDDVRKGQYATIVEDEDKREGREEKFEFDFSGFSVLLATTYSF